jgi:DNA-binding PadR family transcriptional regulator
MGRGKFSESRHRSARGHHRYEFEYGLPRHHVQRARYRARKARRGDIRTAALLILAEEPRNGYQIMQEVEERSGGVWRPSPGSVYPVLQQLEDEGLVRSQESSGQRLIELTDAGRAALADRKPDAPAPWEEIAATVDEHTLELGSLIRQIALASMQVGQVGTDAQITEARKLLGECRRSLYKILAEDEGEKG